MRHFLLLLMLCLLPLLPALWACQGKGRATDDGAPLNLRCVDAPVMDGELRDREQLLSAAMTVATADEIKQLYLEFQSTGVAFHQNLKTEPWGARNFIVKDPDGNLLLFAGPAK